MKEEAPGERLVPALLSGESAGRISTRNAGAVSFSATIKWRSSVDMPGGFVLGFPPPGVRFYSLINNEDTLSATQEISCEMRALYERDLTSALDGALRSVSVHAALTEATLETRAVRLTTPTVAPPTLVEELARQLWNVGLSVSFGPSWTPAPGADVSVGTGGSEEAMREFFHTHPAWQPFSL